MQNKCIAKKYFCYNSLIYIGSKQELEERGIKKSGTDI